MSHGVLTMFSLLSQQAYPLVASAGVIIAMPLGPTVRTRVDIMSLMTVIGLNVGRAADFAFGLRPDRAAFFEGVSAQFWAVTSKQS